MLRFPKIRARITREKPEAKQRKNTEQKLVPRASGRNDTKETTLHAREVSAVEFVAF